MVGGGGGRTRRCTVYHNPHTAKLPFQSLNLSLFALSSDGTGLDCWLLITEALTGEKERERKREREEKRDAGSVTYGDDNGNGDGDGR